MHNKGSRNTSQESSFTHREVFDQSFIQEASSMHNSFLGMFFDS